MGLQVSEFRGRLAYGSTKTRRSVNVLPCASRFKAINPCGLGDISITSIADLIAPKIVTVAEVTHKLIAHFVDIFNYEM
jgi:lipoate-protein ligase B